MKLISGGHYASGFKISNHCQLPEKMLLKLLIMVNFRSFLRLLLKHFPDLTAG